jgi:hypothetical protein
MRNYRHANGRIQHRAAGGTVRQATLADVGMAACACGALVAPDLSACYVNGFIDPRAVREAREKCPECRAKGKADSGS